MGSSDSRTTVLITGASVGIGRDLTTLFAEAGHDLVLVSRNRAALDAVAAECRSRHGVRAEVLAHDLADPGAPQQIYDELRARSLPIDILVNNAGFGTHGPFAETDVTAELQLLQVNIAALTHLTRLFLPDMLQRRSGRILNVASTAGFVPGPYMAIYYASKAYVLAFSVALSQELLRSGVTVTALCPGPTKTEFQKRAGMDEAKLFRMRPMDSLTVARAGYRGLMKGKAIVIPGLGNKLSIAASRLAPRSIVARFVAKLNRNR